MTSSWVRKLTASFVTFVLVLMMSAIVEAYTQTSNELITWANMNTATSDGTFILSASGYSACSYGSSLQTLTGYTFSACEYNNGGCTTTNRNYTFAQYQACALFNYVLDPFMVNSGTSWPTYAGSPTFVTYSYPGGSGSDKMMEISPPGGSLNYGVYQALSNGQTIGAGHAISVTAYLYNQQVGYPSVQCLNSTTIGTPTTVYGSASTEVQVTLGSTSGTVEASNSLSSSTTGTWTSETASFTTPSAGVYYVELLVRGAGVTIYNATETHSPDACHAGTNTTGYGNGFAGNVTTSG